MHKPPSHWLRREQQILNRRLLIAPQCGFAAVVHLFGAVTSLSLFDLRVCDFRECGTAGTALLRCPEGRAERLRQRCASLFLLDICCDLIRKSVDLSTLQPFASFSVPEQNQASAADPLKQFGGQEP